MYQCSCVIDDIANTLAYDDFVEVSTFARYATLPGEGGGIFRDSDQAKARAKQFRELEKNAYRACGLKVAESLDGPSTTPQGERPTGIFLIVRSAAVSTMLTSLEGPFAV